jgi:hypothetical protein
MRVPSVLVLFLSAVTPAWASGGLSCEGTGKQASIQVEGGVTRGMGGPLFSFSGSAKIAAKAVTADLRKIAFDRENVAQYWLDAKELRLLLYRERSGDRPHGYVEVTILAKAVGDDGEYKGSYALTAYDTTGDSERRHEAEGRVTCFVE